MPSDHQMLEHFNLYESEFERLRKISVKYDGFHYPPYDETDSTAYVISSKDKKELDSLIKRLDILLVYSMMGYQKYACSFIHGVFLSAEGTRSMSILQILRII